MEDRAAKLALARKKRSSKTTNVTPAGSRITSQLKKEQIQNKLKDHQEKKTVCVQKDEVNNKSEGFTVPDYPVQPVQQGVEEFTTQSMQNTLDDQLIDVPDTIKTSCLTSPVINKINFNQNEITESIKKPEPDINITEILISNKRNLELQVHDLQTKLVQLEQNHASVISDYRTCTQKIYELENELEKITDKHLNATKEILLKDTKLNELNAVKLSLSEENSNLTEQLEFTKTVLCAKEAENDSLHNQLYNLQNQYDVIHLQLQQLTNGSPSGPPTEKTMNTEKTEALLQKIATLEQQLSLLQKERDQINLHYEHYVAELNEQLRLILKKNDDLTREVENLSKRENSLIEQISDMEIRIQLYNVDKKRSEMDRNTSTLMDLQEELKKAQDDFSKLTAEHEELKNKYAESVAKVNELSVVNEAESNHDNISLSKLNADMTSDKVAAQRATEQNKKLKHDLQGLEDAFVKMTKDKLELTEKIAAEKYLNRELTIKLSEVEEKAKDMQIKLKAKDEEMIRLQSNYRDIEKHCEKLMNLERNGNTVIPDGVEPCLEVTNESIESDDHLDTGYKSLSDEVVDDKNCHSIQRADAMVKLQDRFMKIMGEVADLSDEKHRLEHIILQLQNETDTICEYVALYQQQRSLLKRRDEERSAQLKVFQQECGKLKCELEELSGILARFAEDKELSFYFKTDSKRIDMEHVMTLLSNLKNNSLIDPNKKHIEFKNFYPCNCCSGKLIDV